MPDPHGEREAFVLPTQLCGSSLTRVALGTGQLESQCPGQQANLSLGLSLNKIHQQQANQ